MTAVRRFRLALAAAVVFALAVAGWQADLHWSARNPAPDATIGIGETAEVHGSTFRLDSIDATPQLAALDEEQDPVEAPAGALLVQVVITTEIVGSDVDPDTHYCEATAYDDAGRSWRADAVGYTVAGPVAHSCHGTSEEPIIPGEPLAVGFVFVMPADAVEGLYVDLSLGYDGGMVRLTG